MSIGSRIKQRREELGMTQPELAQKIGVSKGSIGNYESGVSSPNENILFRLFEILKCDANYLYQDDINKKVEIDLDFSEHEKNMIKKYRALDHISQKAVNSIINIEYERNSTQQQNLILSTVAARTKDNKNNQGVHQEYVKDLSKIKPNDANL